MDMENLGGVTLPLWAPLRAYGPYFHKKERRWVVMLRAPVGSGCKHSSISRARFIVSLRLGRLLTPDEEVDHINGDKSDDSDSNLQLLSGDENRRKYLRERKVTRKMARVQCAWCKVDFARRWSNIVGIQDTSWGCCSPSCRGRISAAYQRGRVTLSSHPRKYNILEVYDEPSV